jgi:peptidoglycan/xylan/chitin deacetylase (PgdA/CDA1 family)
MIQAPISVLMYHALFGEDGNCPGADPRYAVSRTTFRRHLDFIVALNTYPTSVVNLLSGPSRAGAVAMTFDDGHASNAAAAEDLAARAGSADFFVNPSMVGQSNYMPWSVLRELSDAGMSIQSHGFTHRYFNELSDDEVRTELQRSKSEIEQHVGKPVVVFAPPGGRLSPRVEVIANEVGYQAICASHVGLWRQQTSIWKIPRLAVLTSTSEPQFQRWIKQDSLEIAKLVLRKRGLDGAKRLFGNRGYEKLRQAVLGRKSVEDSAQ